MEHDFNDPDYEEKQEYFYEYESKLKSCIVKVMEMKFKK